MHEMAALTDQGHAHLCALAGGVEAFCIGSEMRALTQVRGAANRFPAVAALRDLARWLYQQLEAEYDHLTSDESIEEGIIVNEYTFTEAGRRFG